MIESDVSVDPASGIPLSLMELINFKNYGFLSYEHR